MSSPISSNNEAQPIVNRVAQSGIITLNLEDFLPRLPVAVIDLKDFLFKGLVLREQEFRDALKAHNWQQYANTHVAVHCSVDALLPLWAYMLVAAYTQDIAKSVHYGDEAQVETALLLEAMQAMNLEIWMDKKVVIKGCGAKKMSPAAYLAITHLLKPYVASLMYGEPCSTVPVYKKPKPKTI
ncbi:MAG: DUF2480 family protein [Sphingobacteriales bacterium]|nr:DUF2480 family protein [Sphingobacteriales bacterium]